MVEMNTVLWSVVGTLVVLALVVFLFLHPYLKLLPQVRRIENKVIQGWKDRTARQGPSTMMFLPGSPCPDETTDAWALMIVSHTIYQSTPNKMNETEFQILHFLSSAFSIDHQALFLINRKQKKLFLIQYMGNMEQVFAPPLESDGSISAPQAATFQLRDAKSYQDLDDELSTWTKGQVLGAFAHDRLETVLGALRAHLGTYDTQTGDFHPNPYALFQASDKADDKLPSKFDLTCSSYTRMTVAFLKPYLDNFVEPSPGFEVSLTSIRVVGGTVTPSNPENADAKAWGARQQTTIKALKARLQASSLLDVVEDLVDDLTKEMFLFMYANEDRDLKSYGLYKVQGAVVVGNILPHPYSNCMLGP